MQSKTLKKISVRNLVEFILRYGDIDVSKGGGMDINAMLEGARLHRKIQASQPTSYSSEVMLKHRIPFEEFDIQVEGRADGIIRKDGKIIIDEIKCVYKNVDAIKEPELLHAAQAKCYAYMLLANEAKDRAIKEKQENSDGENIDNNDNIDNKNNDSIDNNDEALQIQNKIITIQITYCNIETEEINRLMADCTYKELEEWFLDVVNKYYEWARSDYYHHQEMVKSVESLRFPFNYRKGQKELAIMVYKAMNAGENLYAQAPTGVGKTIAMVYSAVQTVGKEEAEKIFYLTAKTITRTVAANAYEVLRDKGLKFKTVTLTAKEKICILDKPKCNPVDCKRANGHYDRINECLFDIVFSEDVITKEKIEEYANKYNVCPYELSLDICDWTDGIICDYNYVYDPNVSLKRFISEGSGKTNLYLVDEAHNLVDRARNMYSARVCKEDVGRIEKLLDEAFGKEKNNIDTVYNLTKKLAKTDSEFLKLRRECIGFDMMYFDSVGNLYLSIMKLSVAIEELLDEIDEFDGRDELLEYYFDICNFIKIHELLDEHYQIYGELDYYDNFYINLACINPSANLKIYMSKAKSTIFFSATMLPIKHYKELLTGNMEDKAVYIDSPFATANRCIVCNTSVTTKYSERGDNQYKKIYEAIKKIVECKKGNYLVFFPSYRLLENILEIMKEDCFDMDNDLIIQKSGMTEDEREEFLDRFEVLDEGENTDGKDGNVKTKSLIGMCVLGGIFSEGIDLRRESLIGSIIVGTGLPQVGKERDVIKEYYDGKEMDGFDFAYRFPGINKVLQAAGRVIRTESDKGIIALLDNRFNSWQYKELFPREWNDIVFGDTIKTTNAIKDFWNGNT